MGLRFTIAALILIWWFPIPKKLLKDLFIVSLIGGTLTYGLVYMVLNRVDASSSILLSSHRSTFWCYYCLFFI